MEFNSGLRRIAACPAEHEYGVKFHAVVERMGSKEPCVPPKGKENYFCDPRILDPNLTPQQREEVTCEVRTGILTLLAQGRTIEEKNALEKEASVQGMSTCLRLVILAAVIAFVVLVYTFGN